MVLGGATTTTVRSLVLGGRHLMQDTYTCEMLAAYVDGAAHRRDTTAAGGSFII